MLRGIFRVGLIGALTAGGALAADAPTRQIVKDAALAQEDRLPRYEADEAPLFLDLNAGEGFRFRLKSGQERLVRLEAAPRLVVRSTYDYGVMATISVDGHPLEFCRWFSSAKAFQPPTVVNGMRIALEMARAVDSHFAKDNEKVAWWCRLGKDARLLVNDLTMPLWPEIRPMWEDQDLQLTADEIGYRTHTSWGRRDHDTGVISGRLHTDLDLYSPVGTPHYAPFAGTMVADSPIRAQLSSRPVGGSGKTYHLRMIHVSRILKGPAEAFRAGEEVADSGDKQAGSIAHTHFMLIERSDLGNGAPYPEVGRGLFSYAGDGGPHIDPWWLIWQGFQNERSRRGWTRAVMLPLAPTRVGQEVAFSGKGSAAATGTGEPVYRWDFGDGTTSAEANPRHRYDGPGTYLVRLTVSDRKASHGVRQYITVDGPDQSPPQVRSVTCPAQAGEGWRELLVAFSEPVQAGAETQGNYRLPGGPSVQKAVLLAGATAVRLTLEASLAELREYRLKVSGIQDRTGNPCAAGLEVAFLVPRQAALQPVADAQTYDHKNAMDKNFGGEPVISLVTGRGRFDPWPNYGNNKFGYLRFRLPAGKVAAAWLRLCLSGDSPNAFYVLPLEDSRWDEAKITFANAPDLYRPAPLGEVEGRPGGWHELAVTDYVRAARAHGEEVSFGLRAVACDTAEIRVETREGKNPPQLVLLYLPDN